MDIPNEIQLSLNLQAMVNVYIVEGFAPMMGNGLDWEVDYFDSDSFIGDNSLSSYELSSNWLGITRMQTSAHYRRLSTKCPFWNMDNYHMQMTADVNLQVVYICLQVIHPNWWTFITHVDD